MNTGKTEQTVDTTKLCLTVRAKGVHRQNLGGQGHLGVKGQWKVKNSLSWFTATGAWQLSLCYLQALCIHPMKPNSSLSQRKGIMSNLLITIQTQTIRAESCQSVQRVERVEKLSLRGEVSYSSSLSKTRNRIYLLGHRVVLSLHHTFSQNSFDSHNPSSNCIHCREICIILRKSIFSF